MPDVVYDSEHEECEYCDECDRDSDDDDLHRKVSLSPDDLRLCTALLSAEFVRCKSYSRLDHSE